MKLESVDYVLGILGSIYDHFWTKTLMTILVGTYAFLFDVALIASAKALLVLIIIDFITAFYAAKKSGEEIRSRKIFRTPLKILIYFMLVSASHLMEVVSPILTILDETMMSFLALTELISIIENVGRMGYAIPQKLLNKLQQLRDAELSIKK